MRKGADHFEGGQVKAVYETAPGSGQYLIDLVLYDWRGNKIGRTSMHEGGPRSFEPALPLEDFERIYRPSFPIDVALVWKPDPKNPNRRIGRSGYRESIRFAPVRERLRKRSVPARLAKTNIREYLDASALRLAAQTIRDTARTVVGDVRDSLLEQAVRIEKEAAALEAPMK